MALYERLFTLTDVARIHILFQSLLASERDIERAQLAAGAGRRSVGSQSRVALIELAYADWQKALEDTSIRIAVEATTLIQGVLDATEKRPPGTGVAPHLRDAIESRPVTTLGFITGQVGVADEAVLNKVVNPFGPYWGPYWMTQEYGSPRMQNREIYGAFYGPGGGGGGFKPGSSSGDPLFITAVQARAFGSIMDTVGHKMVIRRAPQARHFIRDGADIAVGIWRTEIARIEDATLRRIRTALV